MWEKLRTKTDFPYRDKKIAGNHFPTIPCGRQDLNLHGHPPEPKSGASANSATPAKSSELTDSSLSLATDSFCAFHQSRPATLTLYPSEILKSSKKWPLLFLTAFFSYARRDYLFFLHVSSVSWLEAVALVSW